MQQKNPSCTIRKFHRQCARDGSCTGSVVSLCKMIHNLSKNQSTVAHMADTSNNATIQLQEDRTDGQIDEDLYAIPQANEWQG